METIFLACFVFGLLFTVASFALGAVGGLHFGHSNVHLGGGHAHAGTPHAGTPHVHAGQPNVHGPESPGSREVGVPWLNASSVVGALTWFGAAGYLATRLGGWSLPFVLIAALAVGALGWYLVARFLGLLLKGEVEMDPEDYRLEGTVGKVTVSIGAGSTGEVLFEKAGVRRSEAARSLEGVAIPRGTEVVITSYTDGFATVQPWREFMASRDAESRQRRLTAGETREA
jgi:membrane protein implicated in regulation of membrane protease activity